MLALFKIKDCIHSIFFFLCIRSSPNTFPRRSHRNRPGQGSRTEYASPVPQQRNTRQFRDLGSKKKPGTKFQQSSLDKDADSGAADSSSSESHAVENDDKRQSKNGEEVRSVLGLDVSFF